MSSPRLVLASQSPRRTHLLTMLGLAHEVQAAHIDEAVLTGETPEAHVERLSVEKALAVARSAPEALVLAGDTVVVLGGEILGKPSSSHEAEEMLLRLAGRDHLVVSGLALVTPGGGCASRVEQARVYFRPFDRREARSYVQTGEPLDKAGAYGIQGFGAALVSRVEGDYYTVVGLPIAGLQLLLRECGWRYAFGQLLPLELRSPLE